MPNDASTLRVAAQRGEVPQRRSVSGLRTRRNMVVGG